MSNQHRFPGCILALASALLAPSLPAQTSLTIGTVAAYPGTTVSVPVSLNKATNVAALQMDFSFDPTRATPGSAVIGPRLSKHVLRSREIAPGVHRLLVYATASGSTTVSNRGIVARLQRLLVQQPDGSFAPP